MLLLSIWDFLPSLRLLHPTELRLLALNFFLFKILCPNCLITVIPLEKFGFFDMVQV